MQVNFDNHIEEIPTEGIEFFGQLMKKLIQKASDDGGSILNVKLNGEDITGLDRSSLDDLPIADIGELEIQVGEPQHLARSTLYSAADFLEELLKEIRNTATLYRASDDQKSNDSFLKCIDGIQVFVHTLETCRKLLGVNYNLMMIHSAEGEDLVTVADSRQALFGILDNIIESQSDRDWILLADLLEYELIPSLEIWRQIIPEILKTTESQIQNSELSKELPALGQEA